MPLLGVKMLLFSHSVLFDSLQPHGLQQARIHCPSLSPGACSNSCPLSQWFHLTISSSVIPFSSHLQHFPASESFQTSQFFASGGQNIAVSALVIILSGHPEKSMASHSSTLAWKIPWMEEPGRLQSMGSLRVGYDWVTSLSLFTLMHWRRKWQPTPVFLPGESQGRRSLVGCRLWGRTESDTTEVT